MAYEADPTYDRVMADANACEIANRFGKKTAINGTYEFDYHNLTAAIADALCETRKEIRRLCARHVEQAGHERLAEDLRAMDRRVYESDLAEIARKLKAEKSDTGLGEK